MSGTPIEKRPIEFFNSLQMLEPDMFPSKFHFAMEYCDAKHNGYGWSFKGSKNEEKLHDLINNKIMIRRLKTEVLKDLPEKIKTVLPLEISNRKEYNKADQAFRSWLATEEGWEAAQKAMNAEHLVKFEKLRQLAIKGKMKQCYEWIDNMLENGKLVVFAHHKTVVDGLMKKYKKVAVKIDGSTPAKDRADIVDKFNQDPNCMLFVGTLAAREGISINSTSHLAFLELYWSPGKHDQAEDRIFGIGRGKKGEKSCNIYYLVADNTVEQMLVELLDKERASVDKILDGKETESKNLLNQMLEQMKGATNAEK
jgi:SWI/SNF-related matrix-associated actin-dependent regulator 1 of chromatin subfamily A